MKAFLFSFMLALTGCGYSATAAPNNQVATVPAGDVRTAHFQRLGMF